MAKQTRKHCYGFPAGDEKCITDNGQHSSGGKVWSLRGADAKSVLLIFGEMCSQDSSLNVERCASCWKSLWEFVCGMFVELMFGVLLQCAPLVLLRTPNFKVNTYSKNNFKEVYGVLINSFCAP